MDIRSAKKGTTPQTVSTPNNVKPNVTQPEDHNILEDEFDGNMLLQEYVKFLKEHDVTKDDIFAILETLATTGNIEWGCSIFGGRVPVRFRMRNTWVEDLIASNIDELSANKNLSMARFQNTVRTMNIAGSLISMKDRTFPMHSEEDFEESLKFVRDLPYPILTAISEQLAIFDRAVAVAMSDWALKNFTEPQKEDS